VKLADLGLLTIVTLMVGVTFHFVPRMRRRNLYFGVTVRPEFRDSEEGRAIASNFRKLIWAGTVLALVAEWVAVDRQLVSLLGMAPQLQVLVAVAAWVLAWRRTRRHASAPSGVRSVSLLEKPVGIPGGPLAVILPFAGPVGAAAYLWSKYAELPARYPAHWNGAGQVNRWVEKSPASVFLGPLVGMGALLSLLMFVLAMAYGTRRGTSGERSGWAARFLRLNQWMLISLMWLLSLTFSSASLAPLLPPAEHGWPMLLLVGMTLLTVAGFSVPLIRMSMEPTGGSDATPDECWRGGAIYCNPADPALMVEKREGLGFTLNFGNRLAWVLLAMVLLLVLGPLLVALRLK
jgi:uncharacterized membrane protein